MSNASKTGMVGSSRNESLLSSVGIMSQRKKTLHLQKRMNSARRKNQNELINSLGVLRIQIQVIELNLPTMLYMF